MATSPIHERTLLELQMLRDKFGQIYDALHAMHLQIDKDLKEARVDLPLRRAVLGPLFAHRRRLRALHEDAETREFLGLSVQQPHNDEEP